VVQLGEKINQSQKKKCTLLAFKEKAAYVYLRSKEVDDG
jgi:hypothetical protein